MLKLLIIKDIAVIPRLELEFGPGLNLLTGETGAGKSILIDALGLLLGARASSDLLRTGAERASVEAVFESAAAREVLESHGLPLLNDDEIYLRREIPATGRGRATVNGALVPVAILRELAPVLAAIHGQHEPQELLDPDTHIGFVDRYADLVSLAEPVAAAYKELRRLESALEALRRDHREVARRREMLEFQLREIEAAQLVPGEDEQLRREKHLQANADRLASLSTESYSLLFEDEAAALTRLGQVYRRLEQLAAIDPRFQLFVDGRQAILSQLDDLALFLRDYREGLSVQPGRLDEIESRLALIERLRRKYGATLEEVLEYGAGCERELGGLASPEAMEETLNGQLNEASRHYLEAARELSRCRRLAAPRLESQVREELGRLAMEDARFEVRFDPATLPEDDGEPSGWTERGLETGEFVLSANPGEQLRPLARIASGGELSRIMLALKSVASVDGEGKTLVFDEVDAGIGGGVAEVVGRKLKAISARHQVLCVTHLPQIASQADRHFAVRKRISRARTVTEVLRLSQAERVDELARMLGGERVTESARRHARELIRES
jgi:DNA repair protein RecN (Recombination protein N)